MPKKSATLEAPSPILVAARTKRAKLQAKLEELLTAPTAEQRELNEEETARFEDFGAKRTKLDHQVSLLEADEIRKADAAKAIVAVTPVEVDGTPIVQVRREPMTYEPEMLQSPWGNSFMRDLSTLVLDVHRPGIGQETGGAEGARQRLAQHSKELSIEARTNKGLALAINEIRSTPDALRKANNEKSKTGLEVRVNPNTTLGTGGEFVPPLWLINQYMPFQRAGRVCANRCNLMPLPPGVQSINLPKITTGAAAAIQGTQGGAVASVDIVTSTVTAAVHTIAGQEDISLQLLEQSPIAMDGVVFDDITRDYDQRLDIQVIHGTNASGQHKGVDALTASATANLQTSAYLPAFTSASMVPGTAGGLFNAVANGMNNIHTTRFDRATGIWMHPRRWYFALATAVDSNNRPLIIPIQNAPWNAAGVADAVPAVQGHAGWLWLGLPVFIDANIPTTVSATQDEVIVAKEDDLFLWEGTMRMRALPEVLSGTLQIRFQVYAYSAFMPDRYPPSVALLQGAGGAAPTF